MYIYRRCSVQSNKCLLLFLDFKNLIIKILAMRYFLYFKGSVLDGFRLNLLLNFENAAPKERKLC